MLKRNVRLYPPYLASIAITILATNFILVPLFKIPHMTVTGRDLLLHFGYLNDLFQVPWINVVYWTLAIEFQWYLLVGLVMPALASANRLLRFAITSAMVLSYYTVYWDRLVFHYLPVFLIGVFVFQYRAEIIDVREMLGLIAVMVLATHRISGWLVPLVAVPTGLLIAFSTLPQPQDGPRRRRELLALPAAPADRRQRYRHDCRIGCPYSSYFIGVLDVIGVAASVWAAWIMYQFIEKPSQEWSSAIKLGRRPEPVPAARGGPPSAD